MNVEWTLPTIVDQIESQSSQTWDRVVDPSELRMHGGELYLSQLAQPSKHLKPNTWAEGQLCSKLGIPVTYFRRCPPILKDSQFEYWMDHLYSESRGRTPRLLLRGSEDTLRGVLSERYTCIDNLALIRAIEPLQSIGFAVKGFELTDVSFHLRLVDPTSYQDAGHDDPLFAGIHISNSEVGMRTLSVDALVYRQVCTNGLVRLVKNKSIYARKHIGKSPADLIGIVREASVQALALGGKSVSALLQSKEKHVADPEAMAIDIAKSWSLSELVQEGIIHQLSVEPDPNTTYGLINAITAVAQTQTPDERFRIESLAGSLLN